MCVFVCVFFSFRSFFWVPFWFWVLGAVLFFFPSGFLCAFLFVFSLLFVLFVVIFLALGVVRRAALCSVGLFVCVCVCVFKIPGRSVFKIPFVALGAGRRAALFSLGLFVCVFVCVLSSFSDLFWVPFWLWVLGAVSLFFPSGCLCAFLIVSFFFLRKRFFHSLI